MLFFFRNYLKSVRYLKLNITLFLLCFSSLSCSTVIVDHNNFSWSGGGAYPKFTISGDNKFLISDVSGIWKENSNLHIWGRSNDGLESLSLSNIEFSIDKPAVGYATTKQGIYKTTNSGINWSLVSEIGKSFQSTRGKSYKTIAIYPDDSDSFVYFDQSGRLFEFKHSVVTNISLPITNEYISSILLINNAKALVVGTNKNRYKLEKTNEIWLVVEKVNLSTLDLMSTSLGLTNNVIAVGEQVISISSDKGVTWASHDLIELIGSQSVLSRVSANYSPSGVLQIAAAWNSGWRSGIIISIDEGVTWHKAGKKLYFSDDNPTRKWKNYSMDKVLSVFMSPSEPNNVIVTTYWGVWESNNLGVSWTESSMMGASNTVGSSITLTDNAELITASMDVGLIKYDVNNIENNVTSLLPQSANYNIHKNFAGHFWNVISYKSRIIATNSPWDSKKNQIVISEDSGTTWKSTTTGLPTNYSTYNTVWGKGYARALIQDKNNSQRFLLGIDGYGLFTSIDGGYSWSASSSQPSNLRIYNALALSPVNSDIYWGTIGNGVFVSDDNGNSWHHSGLANTSVFDMKSTHEGAILAGTSGGQNTSAKLYIKEHMKDDWSILKIFPTNYSIDSITLDSKNPDIIVISLNNWGYQNSGRFFISNNRGESWVELEGDFGIGAADMVISNEKKTLYYVGYSQGVSSVDLSQFY